MNLGEGWPKPSFAEARVAAQKEQEEALDRALLLAPILASLDQINAAIQALDLRPQIAAPSVVIPPADYSALVPNLTAALAPLLERPDSAPLAETLVKMTAQLDRMNKKLSGGYLGGGGGGPLTLATSGAVTATNPVPVTTSPAGVYTPYANTSGTVSVPSGAKILSVAATASSAATFTFLGVTFQVPANNQVQLNPVNVVGPQTLVFTGTSGYVVETAQ